MAVTKKTTTVTTTDGKAAKIIQAGMNRTQVGKQPILPTEEEDGVIFNAVGQRVEKETAEKGDAYYNPDGRIVVVQQEKDDQVFVGEVGTNAQWLPKEMVESWPKVPKGEAPSEGDEDEDENPNNSRYGDTVAPLPEEDEEGEEEDEEGTTAKKGKKKKTEEKKSEDDTAKESSY